jgi:beta-N-acetylhexosaminidase
VTRGDLGQLLFVGFDGVELTVDLRAFLSRVRPGGIILFARNLVDPAQTLGLVSELRSLYKPRPLMALDEEGGRVSRLRSMGPTLPPAASLADRGDPELMSDLARHLGALVSSLGFDIDFTPVVDLCPVESTNGIGDRSFGCDPDRVTTMAAACLEGLARSGVTGCLKHFPGLGPTRSDSHLKLPTARKDEAAFRNEDLVPYARLSDRAKLVMVGHGHYPFWAGPTPVAATLVPEIATGVLREELGFRGLALADDLEMRAVSDHVPYEELAPRVILSGCDMALVCLSRDAIERSLAGLNAWSEAGHLPAARVQEACARLQALRNAVKATGKAASRPSEKAFRKASTALQSRLDALA